MADDDDRDEETTGEGEGEAEEGEAEESEEGEGEESEEGEAEESEEGEAEESEEGEAEESEEGEGEESEEGESEEGEAEESEEGEEGEAEESEADKAEGEESEEDESLSDEEKAAADKAEGEESEEDESLSDEEKAEADKAGGEESEEDESLSDDEKAAADKAEGEDEEGLGDDEKTAAEKVEEDEDDWASQEFEPLGVDEDALGSWEDYPDAEREDFEEDAGDWTVDDYTETAKNLFSGTLEHFGDTAEKRYAAAGYAPAENTQGFLSALTQHLPQAVDSLGFFSKDNQVSTLGFVTTAGLAILRRVFPSLDLSGLHVTLPPRDTPSRAPEALPPTLDAVNPADKVDLRKYCTPVGDQGQTSRCAAFAWTHALEMSGNILDRPTGRLSPSYTMMQFQKRQGDFQDHPYAHKGGDGTGEEAQPGPTLAQEGTCVQELWPDEDTEPRAPDEQLAQDAQAHRLPATSTFVGMDDVKKVLTAGCPVVLAMNTGKAFSAIGRDGIVDAAESPSGKHGRHAMLIVGYVSNYYIVKNSWGTDWGDGGYCYIPKKVLADANPEFEAVLLRKGVAPSSGPRGASGGGRAGEAAPTEAGGADAAPPTVPSPPLSAWQAPAVETPTLSVAQPSSLAGPLSAAQGLGLATGPSLLVTPPRVAPPAGPVPVAAASQVQCAACGTSVAQGKFCPACGKPLAAPARRFCPQCGVEAKPSDKFCSGCGAPVGR